jgi:hypothetical protein
MRKFEAPLLSASMAKAAQIPKTIGPFTASFTVRFTVTYFRLKPEMYPIVTGAI